MTRLVETRMSQAEPASDAVERHIALCRGPSPRPRDRQTGATLTALRRRAVRRGVSRTPAAALQPRSVTVTVIGVSRCSARADEALMVIKCLSESRTRSNLFEHGHRPGRPPSPTRYSGHRPATGGLACGFGSAPHHRRRRGRGRQGRDRCHLAAVGVRRPRRAGRRGPHPAHSARRVAGALRGSGRRQPPPSDLPHLRPSGRRGLRRRLRAVPHGGRRQGLRNRRGRGRLLGTLSGLPGAGPDIQLRFAATPAPTDDRTRRASADPATDRKDKARTDTQTPVPSQ